MTDKFLGTENLMYVTGNSFWKYLITFFVFALHSIANAGIGLTYQGRILRPDSTPLESSNVRFTVEIRSYNDCLLYEESQTLNMSTSAGVFALNIGSAPAPQIHNYVGTSLSAVFTNRGSFTGLSGCTGGTYTPNADDDRKIVVSFEDLTPFHHRIFLTCLLRLRLIKSRASPRKIFCA